MYCSPIAEVETFVHNLFLNVSKQYTESKKNTFFTHYMPTCIGTYIPNFFCFEARVDFVFPHFGQIRRKLFDRFHGERHGLSWVV
jgi:hypothetical protein